MDDSVYVNLIIDGSNYGTTALTIAPSKGDIIDYSRMDDEENYETYEVLRVIHKCRTDELFVIVERTQTYNHIIDTIHK